jgi:hypothetical protein
MSKDTNLREFMLQKLTRREIIGIFAIYPVGVGTAFFALFGCSCQNCQPSLPTSGRQLS